MDPSAILTKPAIELAKFVFKATSTEQLAQALTGEQGWGRRLLRLRDPIETITLTASESIALRLKNELTGDVAAWQDTAAVVAEVLEPLNQRQDFLYLLADREQIKERLLSLNSNRFRHETMTASEAARFDRLLDECLSILRDLAKKTEWFANEGIEALLRDSSEALPLVRGNAAQLSEIAQDLKRRDHAYSYQPLHGRPPEWPTYRSHLATFLARTPDYYPPALTNLRMAELLAVVDVDYDSELHRFDTPGLYWQQQMQGDTRPALDLLRSSPLTVLLGDPGSGKTTIAKALVSSALDRNEIALFLRAEDMAHLSNGSRILELSDAIELAWASSLRTLFGGDPTLTEAVPPQAILGAVRLTIVIDALDEMSEPAGWEIVVSAAQVLSGHGHHVAITSRISGYLKSAHGARHAFVPPMEPGSVMQVARAWLGTDLSSPPMKRFNLAVEADHLSGMLLSPLVLGFVCFIAERDAVPPTRGEIFNRFVDHFFRKAWHEPHHQMQSATQVVALTKTAIAAAWIMANPPTLVRASHWSDVQTIGGLAQQLPVGSDVQLLLDSGMLIPFGSLEPRGSVLQSVRWLHRVLHEHFVAKRVVQLTTAAHESLGTILLHAALTPQWTEVIHQTCQLLGDGADLHAAIDALDSEAGPRDSMEFLVGGALALMTQYCGCQGRSESNLALLIRRRQWYGASSIDLHRSIAEYEAWLRSRPSEIQAQDPSMWPVYFLQEILSADDPRVDSCLSLLGALTAEEEVADLKWARRLLCRPLETWRLALEFSVEQGALPRFALWRHREKVANHKDAFFRILREVLDNPKTAASIPLHDLAYWTHDLWLSDDIDMRQGPRLTLLIALARAYSAGVDPITVLSEVPPFALCEADRIAWGSLLAEAGWPAWRLGRETLALSSALRLFEEGQSARTGFRLIPGPVSSELAECVILAFNKMDPGAITINDAERVVWALCVLSTVPATGCYAELLGFKLDLSRWLRGLDSNQMTAVQRYQDWETIIPLARSQCNEDEKRAWAALALVVAAQVATFPFSPYFRRPVAEAVSLYFEGLEGLLSTSLSVPATHGPVLELPTGLRGDDLSWAAERVHALCSGKSGLIAEGAMVGLERALYNEGALSGACLEIRLPRAL